MPFGLNSSDTIALASLLVAVVSMIYTMKASYSASRRIDAIEKKPVLWLELDKLAEGTWRATVNARC